MAVALVALVLFGLLSAAARAADPTPVPDIGAATASATTSSSPQPSPASAEQSLPAAPAKAEPPQAPSDSVASAAGAGSPAPKPSVSAPTTDVSAPAANVSAPTTDVPAPPANVATPPANVAPRPSPTSPAGGSAPPLAPVGQSGQLGARARPSKLAPAPLASPGSPQSASGEQAAAPLTPPAATAPPVRAGGQANLAGRNPGRTADRRATAPTSRQTLRSVPGATWLADPSSARSAPIPVHSADALRQATGSAGRSLPPPVPQTSFSAAGAAASTGSSRTAMTFFLILGLVLAVPALIRRLRELLSPRRHVVFLSPLERPG